MFDLNCKNTWVNNAMRAKRIAACIADNKRDTWIAVNIAVTFGTAEIAHYVNWWWFLDNAKRGREGRWPVSAH